MAHNACFYCEELLKNNYVSFLSMWENENDGN